MKIAVAILLVCVVIPNVYGFLGFSSWSETVEKVKHHGKKIAEHVEQRVDEASNKVNSHKVMLKEYEKKAMEKLREYKTKLAERKEEMKETKGRWRQKAEKEWLKFKTRAEEGLEHIKGGIDGIRESLDTNEPERPRELMKALKLRLKDIIQVAKEVFHRKSQGSEEEEELPYPEFTDEEEEGEESLPEEVPTPEVYPEIFPTEAEPNTDEPTEIPTPELIAEFPEEPLEKEEDNDWWVGPEGDGLQAEEAEEDDDEEEDEEEPIEEGEVEAEKEEEAETPLEEEAEEAEEAAEEYAREAEEDADESEVQNSSQEESEESSPLDFFGRRNRGKLARRLKIRAKHILNQWRKRVSGNKRQSDNGSEEP